MAKGGSSASERVGSWAFIIGLVVAIVLGWLPATAFQAWVVGLLLVLGVIVGFLNISEREIVPFLVACVAFLVAAPAFGATVSGVVGGFDWLGRVLSHVAVLVLPGALIASVKAIVALAATR